MWTGIRLYPKRKENPTAHHPFEQCLFQKDLPPLWCVKGVHNPPQTSRTHDQLEEDEDEFMEAYEAPGEEEGFSAFLGDVVRAHKYARLAGNDTLQYKAKQFIDTLILDPQFKDADQSRVLIEELEKSSQNYGTDHVLWTDLLKAITLEASGEQDDYLTCARIHESFHTLVRDDQERVQQEAIGRLITSKAAPLGKENREVEEDTDKLTEERKVNFPTTQQEDSWDLQSQISDTDTEMDALLFAAGDPLEDYEDCDTDEEDLGLRNRKKLSSSSDPPVEDKKTEKTRTATEVIRQVHRGTQTGVKNYIEPIYRDLDEDLYENAPKIHSVGDLHNLTYEPKVPFEEGKIIPEGQVKGEITFKNVTFEYPTKEGVKVLENFSFEAK